MVKRKLTAASNASPSKKSKLSNRSAFTWKPTAWITARDITIDVSVLVNRNNRELFVVKKVLPIAKDSSAKDIQPTEIRALLMLPNCNRIVKPLLYSPFDPDHTHGTIIFSHYPLGDLEQWKVGKFDNKNMKPVPESYIWRCFLQISQALAFLQSQIGPNRGERHCLLHRDIKPKNILVVNNGTTYPSFKLHDFGLAFVYWKTKAKHPAICGTFQWQPPENPIINTKAADIWALGACIHFLAIGRAPTEDLSKHAATRFKARNQHPESALDYSDTNHYYHARAPRRVLPINLSKEEQRQRKVGPNNHQYSDELNGWMSLCLSLAPSRRPDAVELVYDMGVVAKDILKMMGGKAALADVDAKFGAEA